MWHRICLFTSSGTGFPWMYSTQVSHCHRNLRAPRVVCASPFKAAERTHTAEEDSPLMTYTNRSYSGPTGTLQNRWDGSSAGFGSGCTTVSEQTPIPIQVTGLMHTSGGWKAFASYTDFLCMVLASYIFCYFLLSERSVIVLPTITGELSEQPPTNLWGPQHLAFLRHRSGIAPLSLRVLGFITPPSRFPACSHPAPLPALCSRSSPTFWSPYQSRLSRTAASTETRLMHMITWTVNFALKKLFTCQHSQTPSQTTCWWHFCSPWKGHEMKNTVWHS